jgi:hypothetical protein
MGWGLPVTTDIDSFYTVCYSLLLKIVFKSAKISPDNVVSLHEYLTDVAEPLHEHCSESFKYFSSAPVITAAIVTVKSGGDRDYVFDLYRNLVIQNYATVPPVGMAFYKDRVRALENNVRREKRMTTFNKAMHMFDPANADLKEIHIFPSLVRKYEQKAIAIG